MRNSIHIGQRIFIMLMIVLPVIITSATLANDITERKNRLSHLSSGDILYLYLPGEDSLSKTYQIDRNGRILLSELGEISISGLTLEEAKTTLKSALSEVYRDMTRFNLTLKEKRLLITVLGYVKKPGLVDLAKEGGIQSAINQAGGLVPGAQLDKFQLRRKNEVIIFDYKNYLDSGDVNSLPQLFSLDTIFVPSSPLIGNVQADFDAAAVISGGDASEDKSAIRVFGEVRNPGVFSFKENMTVLDMILRAGGATRFGNVEHIRVINNNNTILFNLKSYLDGETNLVQPILYQGATIYIPKESEELKSGGRTVYIMGQVPKPGAYESNPNATLLEILGNAGGSTRFADPSKISIIRSTGSVDRFDLNEYLSNPQGVEALPRINSGDAIYVPELPKDPANKKSLWVHLPKNKSIYVMGEVNSPGRYRYEKSFNFLDVLSAADGPSTNADLHNIRLTHRSKAGIQVSKLDLSLYFRTGDESLLPNIDPEDTIYIPPKSQHWLDEKKEDTVRVIGAVGKPGRYRFANEMTLLDIIAEAGGTTSEAYIEKIIVVSKSCCEESSTTFNLNRFSKTADYSMLPLLSPGDTVYVPNVSESHWKIVMGGLRDVVSILSFIVLLGAL